jgi:hypothetical protein
VVDAARPPGRREGRQAGCKAGVSDTVLQDCGRGFVGLLWARRLRQQTGGLSRRRQEYQGIRRLAGADWNGGEGARPQGGGCGRLPGRPASRNDLNQGE